jgi:hypothetical protein
MLTAADVVTAPALSVAFAVSEYVPAATPLQEYEYGLTKSSPSFVDPLKNSTLLTDPSESLAEALIVTEAGAVKLAPFEGEVMLTVGALLLLFTVTVTVDDVVLALLLSVACAVMLYVPAATPFQMNEYGLVRSSPSFVDPLKNSTLLTVPSESDAVALIVMFASAVNEALLAGDVTLTVGATFEGAPPH